TLVFAGPAMDDDENMCASVWVIKARDRQHAEEILSGDPYEKVDLFETKIIRKFIKTGGV
ncbi:MAG: YciI family protein, partial [Alphaproteobacteria bacterium]